MREGKMPWVATCQLSPRKGFLILTAGPPPVLALVTVAVTAPARMVTLGVVGL